MKCRYTAKRGWKIIAMMVCLLCWASTGYGQSTKEKLKRIHVKVDSVLTTRYNKVRYDTNYVGRPPQKLTLKIRPNLSGSNITMRGDVAGVYTKTELGAAYRGTISLCVSYIGISAALSINPGSLSGKNKDVEMNLNYYSPRFCVDASYQVTKTLAGGIERGDNLWHFERGLVNLKVASLTAYYIFNHRRFSFPAAFTQSYIQKKSAGSWLAGLSFEMGKVKRGDNAPISLPKLNILVGHVALGGGYAYNFAVGRKWLFHVSAMPTLVVANFNDFTVGGHDRDVRMKFPSALLNEHAAIVYNCTPRYFVGGTGLVTHTLFNAADIHVSRHRWLARVFFGVRLL